MLKNPSNKYRAFPAIDIPDRTWPSRAITQAPIWLSSDLRDGNQSLIEPMDAAKKMRFFKTLVQVGLKGNRGGLPSASQTDFDFVRELIEGGHIPDDVTIQVLTQAREDLITRTFEVAERRQAGHRPLLQRHRAELPPHRLQSGQGRRDPDRRERRQDHQAPGRAEPETNWRFEYSPEIFSSTEPEFAVEVCNAVIEVFQPTPEQKLILNLPATVEAATPNVYADQIEWFCRH